jgi:hypothetical protein
VFDDAMALNLPHILTARSPPPSKGIAVSDSTSPALARPGKPSVDAFPDDATFELGEHKQLVDVHAVELWLEGRKIATFAPDQ